MYPVSIDETSIAPTVAGPTRASIMPAHPDLRAAFQTTLAYENVTAFRIIDAHPTTAWRWVQVNLADLLVADVHECKRRLRVVTNYEEYRKHPHRRHD